MSRLNLHGSVDTHTHVRLHVHILNQPPHLEIKGQDIERKRLIRHKSCHNVNSWWVEQVLCPREWGRGVKISSVLSFPSRKEKRTGIRPVLLRSSRTFSFIWKTLYLPNRRDNTSSSRLIIPLQTHQKHLR